ncbi:MAG: flavodoxin family protein [Armatimonadota bacterium]
MPSILVISASPRKHANSDLLADRLVAGATAAGAQVEKIRLRDLTINYCKACDACQKSAEALCVQQDDMNALLPKLRAADVLVFASPIYFFIISGQMKVFLDRTYALGGGSEWSALHGKKCVTLFTYADANPMYSGVTNAYRTFQDACLFLGLTDAGCLHATCSAAGEIAQNAAILEEAEALGRKLAG